MAKDHSGAFACTGAVIGAGFASGREIVAFFARYQQHGSWLVVLAALTMTGLCLLCMKTACKNGCDWVNTLCGSRLAAVCPLLLMTLTAGAMISASGHITALVWRHSQAYVLGMLGTLLFAGVIGNRSLKAHGAVSALLAIGLLCALLAVLTKLPLKAVQTETVFGFKTLVIAGIRAAGYAAMNVVLAIGEIYRTAVSCRKIRRTAMLFGLMTGMLMMLSYQVYLRFPASKQMAFPMIGLLNGYGKIGYLSGAALLYLSVVTTLASVLYALRNAAENRISRREWRWLVVYGIPLGVAGIGFEGIVDRLYAPAGLICLMIVFLPMMKALRNKSKASFS